jgi:hypothetical protein
MQDMSVPHSQPGSQPSDADEVFQPSSPNEDSSSLSASCLEEELPQYVSLYSSSKADFAYTSTLTEESLEDHGMLRERIDKCRTIAECVQIYQDELYQKCLSKIENAQKEEREAMEKQNVPKKDDLFMFRVREAWSKKWATAMVNNEEWAMTFEKCRMTGLRLLLRLCDCWQEDRTVIEADIVKKFKKEKVERIFLLCLPLDRANSLFKMVSTKTGVRGLHWYANVHTEWKDLNGGTINKRYMMLYGIRGLNLESNQEIKMWFEPKAAHKTTTVIANNTTQKGDTQLGEGIRQRRGAAKQSNIDVTRCCYGVLPKHNRGRIAVMTVCGKQRWAL